MSSKQLLIVLAIACSVFSWDSLHASAQDASGHWRGQWAGQSPRSNRQHQGTLRVRLRPSSDGRATYQGTFSGRFAFIIPYFYRAPVYQSGNRLYSTKRLGPFGDYQMSLSQVGNRLTGHWQTANQGGSIDLRRAN